MGTMRTRLVTAVSAAALAAGGAGALLFAPGLATAQDEPAEEAPAEEAEEVAPFERRGSLLADALAELVEEGVLDQTQADAVQEKLQEKFEEIRPRFEDRAHPRGRFHRGRIGLDAAAGAIGIEPEELRAALIDGQSLADVAEANGVDRQAVVEALTDEVQARIDAQLESGHIDQERADDLAAAAAERIEAMVDRTFERPAGFDGFRDRFRDHFRDRFPDSVDPPA